MKKLLVLLVVSVIGGAISLGTYKTFLEQEQKVVIESVNSQPILMPTNLSTTKSNSAISQGIDFVEAAEKTVDAVVHVMNTTISRAPVTIQDLFFGRSSERAQIGSGSGVIISPDGYIVTNNHVIDGAQSLSVTLNDNRTLSAELIGTDSRTDIALLKIESDEELPYTRFGDSDQAKVGEWVLAVGNPFNLTSTVTAGIISAKSRDLSGQNSQSFIQTDAAVNPGNSGGALVNINGDLIGINTAITSQTGSYIGYSFAVPSNIARKVIEDIMEFGNVQNGILGVTGGELNSAYAKKLGLEETEGFYIDDVEEKSGAESAGLRSGDIIKKLDNVEISKFADLSGYLNSKRPNDVVNVTILRRGSVKKVPVKLSKRGLDRVEFIGLELRNLSKEAKEKYDLEGGAYVYKSNNYELFKKLGLKNGYIITEINDEEINNIEDIQRLKENYGNGTLEKNIYKMGVINEKGQRERFIFK